MKGARRTLRTAGRATFFCRVAGVQATGYTDWAVGVMKRDLEIAFPVARPFVSAARRGVLRGVVSARTGTIKRFELGSHRFDNPTVVFSTATVGTFTDPYLAGNIGIDVLKSFTVVFDFTGSRAAFLK